MFYSDDEDEFVPPMDVTDYKFVYGDDKPVSFAELPLQLNEQVTIGGKPSKKRVYLRGKTDKGIRSIYTEVTAWKFDLSCKDKPDLSVLSVDDDWIKLLNPIRAFEDIIMTVLVTVEFLHIVKWDCKISSKGLWDCLCKRFSMFDDKPCEEDLVENVSLIRETIKRDGTLAKSKIISTFLKEPRKKIDLKEVTLLQESKFSKPFLGMDKVYDSEEHRQYENADASDDDGDDNGYVCAICDNGGDITQCEGKCMRSFHLTNEAGESDGEADGCSSLGFTKEQVEQMQNDAFYCKNCEYKQHQCFSCGGLGSSDKSSFGCVKVFCCINGTCGRFYHPDCVAKLLHPNDEVAEKEQHRRISSGEHFTCPAHKCDVCKELELKLDKQLQFAVCRRCPRAYHRKCLPWNIAFEADVNKGRATVQRAWEDLIPNRILIYCLDHDIDDDLLTPLRNHIKFPRQMDSLEGKSNLLEDTSSNKTCAKPLEVVEKLSSDYMQSSVSSKRVELAHEISKSHNLDDDARKRILSLMKDASTSITLEEIKKRHANSSKLDVDNITLGKVEASVQAMRAALQILDKGGSVEDAKVVFGNDLLLRHAKWREMLRTYLAPFLSETRYTSLGPYFIKTDKLQEIVNMLHCYIQDGDMMVDICCGSKDFSVLLKKKLNEVGKTCSFKNFDIVQAKTDFCFEGRDWMTVEPHELPDGSQLIMNLNPPLGVNVALVNEFINKALTFKPKLLILIVPRETQRLDEKDSPYDLIWEDNEMFAGKASLPGSVVEHDKQIDDWKVKARILYLWSNPDWTQKHNAVAELHGHLGSRKNRAVEENLINQSEEPISIGENNGGLSNNRSEGNLKDFGNNKRKIDMDMKAVTERPPNKRPALNLPLSKLGPSEAHSSKHLERKSSHVHCGKDHSEYNASLRTDDKGISKNCLSETSEIQLFGKKRNNDSPRHASKLDSDNRATTKRCTSYLSEGNPKDSGENKSKREHDNKAAQEKYPTDCPALNPTLSKLSSSEEHSSKHLERQSTHIHRERDLSEVYNASPKMDDKGISEYYSCENITRQSLVQKMNSDSPTHVHKLDCCKRASTELCTAYSSEGNRKDSEKDKINGELDKKAGAEENSALNLPLLKLGPSKARSSKHLDRQSSKILFWRDRYDSSNSSRRMGLESRNLKRQPLVQKRNNDPSTHVRKPDYSKRSSTERCTRYPSFGYAKNNKRKREGYMKAAADAKPLTRRRVSPSLLKLGPSAATSAKHLERQLSHVNFEKDRSELHNASPSMGDKGIAEKHSSESQPLVEKNNDSPAHVLKLDCCTKAAAEKSTTKCPALNPPLSNLDPSVVHSPKHLERQSSLIHSRNNSSDTENASPRMGHKGISENYTSKILDRQSLVQEKNNVSPAHVTKPDCTSSLPVQSQSQGSAHVSSCLSRQVNPTATPTMQKYAPCLNNANHVQKTTFSARPPVIDKYNQPLIFTPASYRPRPGTYGWVEE